MDTSTLSDLESLILHLAQEFQPDLVQVRRHLHQVPELSESEYRTTEYLCGRVRQLGLEPTLGPSKRGCYVDFGTGEHRVLVRGDIDALPIQTELAVPYASRVSGIMHACGHDAHSAMAYGALQILRALEERGALPSATAIRCTFQPAEETSTGALELIHAGVLANISSAMALHVDPTRQVGTVGSRIGSFTAGCDTFSAEIIGEAGHSARPHMSGDTMAAVAEWINDAIARIPRCHDAREPVVFSVGTIAGGTASNIVPSRIQMTGTMRSVSHAGTVEAKRMLQRISDAIEMRFEVKVKLEYGTHTPPLVNDAAVASCMQRSAIALLGAEHVHTIHEVSMGAEDFAFFSLHVPTAMMRLGVGNEHFDQPLHSSKFNLDERALPLGAAILAASAIRWGEHLRDST